MSPRLLLLVAPIAACTFFNPAYDESGRDDASASASASTAGTTPGTTADASSSTTSTATTSASATSAEPTTTAAAATTDTTTTQGTSESEGTTAGAGACWGSDLHTWEVTPIPGIEGLDERSPRISADGLSLVFRREVAPMAVYRALRPDRQSDFIPDKTPLAEFMGVYGIDYFNLRGDELLFALTEVEGGVTQIAQSTHDGYTLSLHDALPI